MAAKTPWWRQRHLWTVLLGLAALAFWVVGLGSGWRGWILTGRNFGIVAHAQGFGVEAYIWWIPASVLTLATVVMAVGVAVVRHLVEGPLPVRLVSEQEPGLVPLPEREPLPEQPTLPEVEPVPETGDESDAGAEAEAEDGDTVEATTPPEDGDDAGGDVEDGDGTGDGEDTAEPSRS